VPTAISLSDRVEIKLLTADEFLDWLKLEVHAEDRLPIGFALIFKIHKEE
jgi:hypothetical protein